MRWRLPVGSAVATNEAVEAETATVTRRSRGLAVTLTVATVLPAVYHLVVIAWLQFTWGTQMWDLAPWFRLNSLAQMVLATSLSVFILGLAWSGKVRLAAALLTLRPIAAVVLSLLTGYEPVWWGYDRWIPMGVPGSSLSVLVMMVVALVTGIVVLIIASAASHDARPVAVPPEGLYHHQFMGQSRGPIDAVGLSSAVASGVVRSRS